MVFCLHVGPDTWIGSHDGEVLAGHYRDKAETCRKEKWQWVVCGTFFGFGLFVTGLNQARDPFTWTNSWGALVCIFILLIGSCLVLAGLAMARMNGKLSSGYEGIADRLIRGELRDRLALSNSVDTVEDNARRIGFLSTIAQVLDAYEKRASEAMSGHMRSARLFFRRKKER